MRARKTLPLLVIRHTRSLVCGTSAPQPRQSRWTWVHSTESTASIDRFLIQRRQLIAARRELVANSARQQPPKSSWSRSQMITAVRPPRQQREREREEGRGCWTSHAANKPKLGSPQARPHLRCDPWWSTDEDECMLRRLEGALATPASWRGVTRSLTLRPWLPPPPPPPLRPVSMTLEGDALGRAAGPGRGRGEFNDVIDEALRLRLDGGAATGSGRRWIGGKRRRSIIREGDRWEYM